ncbi:hypothetical protein GCM10018952_66370 [Streptosporangium vulgare]
MAFHQGHLHLGAHYAQALDAGQSDPATVTSGTPEEIAPPALALLRVRAIRARMCHRSPLATCTPGGPPRPRSTGPTSSTEGDGTSRFETSFGHHVARSSEPIAGG